MTTAQPHYSDDYGLDPQLDFFQVLGEARRHCHHREAATARASDHSSSSAAAVRFKLQKPIGKDQDKKKKKKKKKWSSSSSRNRKPGWSWSWPWPWKSALDLFYFKLKWPVQEQPDKSEHSGARTTARHSVSGPLYLAESRNASRPLHRGYSRSGPLASSVPYMCLSTDFITTAAAPPPPSLPLYLVT